MNFKRVFHYFHHPFWGTFIFGNTHITIFLVKLGCRFVFGSDDGWTKSAVVITANQRTNRHQERVGNDLKGVVERSWDIGWM